MLRNIDPGSLKTYDIQTPRNRELLTTHYKHKLMSNWRRMVYKHNHNRTGNSETCSLQRKNFMAQKSTTTIKMVPNCPKLQRDNYLVCFGT